MSRSSRESGTLHPAVAARLEAASDPGPRPTSVHEAVTLARAEHRTSTAAVASPVESDVVVTEHQVPAAHGFLKVREYRAETSGPLPPSIVFLHGGGWVTGTLDTYDDLCSRLAEALDGAVFSVEYRLAPEVSYPGGVDDAEIALRWLMDGARELAVDPSRVWVAGDSAGGTLAAVVARRLRDRPLAEGQSLAGQVLWYPVTDARMDTGSYREFGDGYGLTAGQMSWFWDLYCPDPERRSEPDASPLRAKDLSGIPSLFLTLASHDPLRDEGLAYGSRLKEAGVSVQVRVAPGMVHGFLRWTAILDESAQYIHEAAQAVRTAGPVRSGQQKNRDQQ